MSAKVQDMGWTIPEVALRCTGIAARESCRVLFPSEHISNHKDVSACMKNVSRSSRVLATLYPGYL